MKILKKLGIIIFIALIAVLSINVKSNAYSVGQQLTLNYNDYAKNKNIYCMEHNQALNRNYKTYKIISNVKIKGRTSTDHKGKSIDSWYNSKMLAILSEDNGSHKQSGPVQNGVWNFGATWIKKVGQYHNGLYLGFASDVHGKNTWLDKESSKVADNSKEELKISDKTNKSKIKIVSYEKDGKEYIRVGPFNWEFSSKLDEIKVYNQNSKVVSGVLYSRFNGNRQEWIKVSEIKSGKDFYISIPAESQTTKITKITGKITKKVDTVDIWFLKALDAAYQNLIIVDKDKETVTEETNFDYNIELIGDLIFEKVDEDNKEIKLPDVKFIIKNEDTGKYVNLNNGKITYVDKANAYKFTTNKQGKIEVKNLIVGNYIIYEIENPHYGYEEVSFDNPKKIATLAVKAGNKDETKIQTVTNDKYTGNIKLYKKDYETGNALAGMTFILKASNGKYVVAVGESGKTIKQSTGKVYFANIQYTENIEDATKFTTDDNGTLEILNIIVDTYELIEYSVGDKYYGYEVDGEYIHWEVNGKEATGVSMKVELTRQSSKDTTNGANVSDKNSNVVTVKNQRKYVKLSGYVWVDEIEGKQSLRNEEELFKENENQSNDILLDGITVRLKDKRTGETLKETVTSELGRYKDSRNNGHGEYLFEDILIKDLDKYYIEFEYDGLTYTNVTPHIDKDNGSKASESANERKEFNSKFSTVEGESENTGFTTDANGQKAHNLSYNIDKAERKATLINNGQYLITGNTDEAKYNIKEHYKYEEEIKYINLGLYEREQPDLAIIKDIENVIVTVNGYEHTYLYSQRTLNAEEYGDGFNVGVKFGEKYGTLSYSRAVYKADYEYINENDKDKELKVYVTYKIAIRNQATHLKSRVNSLVDYYDSNYTIVNAGTELNERGYTNGNIKHTDSKYNDAYSKTVLDTNLTIDAQKQASVYVQFKLNREAVLKILNDQENLENVAEINSYSVFDKDGNVYAGIDVDSNPANAVPGDVMTYQDDTDRSPALKLEVADAREMSGKVFLDSTTGELRTGEVRQGSGAYEDGEKGIEGVQIKLTENTGSGKEYTATTDANGDFYISGYIPGDYTLTYTWGDNTYTVQNYKGTVYDSSRDQNNKKWYKENVDSRLTDAIDNYQTRQNIDNEIKNIKNSTITTIDKMDSTTPTMGIGVEYETTYTASTGDRYTYLVKNIDFGIVERARQDLGLTKRVKTMKVTLANGQVIVDLSIDKDGNITGEKNYIAYMKPSQNAEPKNGFIKLELDNELIQGATVEMGYEFTATNNSELDYLSEKFYKYGIVEGNVITIRPSGIIDYLDNDWSFEGEQNSAWQVKSVDEIKNIVAETVYNNENTDIQNKTILYTESLKEQKLKPTESATVMLNVSKMLANSDEISLDNETEITEITKDGGSKVISTPGNYIPGTSNHESDSDMAETTIVTPSTGENQNFILPIVIGMISLVILGAGIFFIKKKVVK